MGQWPARPEARRPVAVLIGSFQPTNSLNPERISYASGPETLELRAMLRVRLKADGRLVEVLPDGSEGPISISNGTSARHGGNNAATPASWTRPTHAMCAVRRG